MLSEHSYMTSKFRKAFVQACCHSLKLPVADMMWFGHVRDNRCCQILSVNGAFSSLVICAVPTPVKTTPELSGPAFGVLPWLPKTGGEELEDRCKPG